MVRQRSLRTMAKTISWRPRLGTFVCCVTCESYLSLTLTPNAPNIPDSNGVTIIRKQRLGMSRNPR